MGHRQDRALMRRCPSRSVHLKPLSATHRCVDNPSLAPTGSLDLTRVSAMSVQSAPASVVLSKPPWLRKSAMSSPQYERRWRCASCRPRHRSQVGHKSVTSRHGNAATVPLTPPTARGESQRGRPATHSARAASPAAATRSEGLWNALSARPPRIPLRSLGQGGAAWARCRTCRLMSAGGSSSERSPSTTPAATCKTLSSKASAARSSGPSCPRPPRRRSPRRFRRTRSGVLGECGL